MKKMRIYLTLLLSIISLLSNAKDVNILDYGAKPDGKTDNTVIIQNAIDQCTASGGGTVYVPEGTYLSGTIFLKDNITLELNKLAVLKGVDVESAYPDEQIKGKGFIRIDHVSNVSIIGEGTIDGNGSAPIFQKGSDGEERPFLLHIRGSKNLVIKDVHLRNSANWTLHLFENDGVRIDGISIYSHINWNNDGIDIDSKNVTISNCRIDCVDDAICFKSDSKIPCENVVVTNCNVASNCNFIKFGTAGFGGFKNISVSNCVLHAASESKQWHWNKIIDGVTDTITGISGIALEMVDGGVMDQITISNIAMTGIQTPVFIRLGSRRNPTGTLKNVLISNIAATAHSRIASCISAVPGFYIENVVIRDMIVNCMGGGTVADANRVVPEKEKDYPENRMFGDNLPAYGMYVRHARNIYLDNIQFNLLQPDARPAVVLDDCNNIRLNNFDVDLPLNNQPLIRIIQSSNIAISDYQSITPITTFLKIEGEKSSDIKLTGNDFSRVKTVFELGSECKASAVKEMFNFK